MAEKDGEGRRRKLTKSLAGRKDEQRLCSDGNRGSSEEGRTEGVDGWSGGELRTESKDGYEMS